MRLYIKQKVFSLRAKFNITDQQGYERYHVEGELLSLTRKLHIYDAGGEEVALVHKKLISLLPQFVIEKNGRETARIKKRFTLFKPAYEVEGKGWTVQGDLWSHDYEITDSRGTVIADIHKVWMSWGDSFELDLDSREDEVDLLAVILAIDMVMDDQAAAANSASY
ncbi:MAG: LURP-one-related family protein [Clostridiales bacterium]|nr:LURP-one-related family protein [Clostridiales bacterium]